MVKRFYLLTAVLFFSPFLFQGCATKIYTDAMKAGYDLELKSLYITAYNEYKKALDDKPNDKKASAKIEELGKLIADDFIKQGNKRFQAGYYLDAKYAFDQALIYRKDYDPALNCLLELDKASKVIEKKYSLAQEFEAENQWIQAIDILKEIQAVYQDDSDLTSQIESLENNGYTYFQDLGISSQKAGRYKKASELLKTAQKLKNTDQIKQDILLNNKYLKADEYYQTALVFFRTKTIEQGFDKLILARELVDDHKDANLLYSKILNDWSGILLFKGKNLIENDLFEDAYIVLKKLYTQNPEFPEAVYYYKLARDNFLKTHYSIMIESLKLDDLEQVINSGNEIFKIKPDYLDLSEILNQVLFKAFNMFYQCGLHFLQTGNYGKAILAFRSAEDQLGNTLLTQENIDLATKKIIDENSLRIAFWNFIFEKGESGIANHATLKLKEDLKLEETKSSFKNIKLQYDIITDKEMALWAEQNTVDWGVVQSKNCNALISGKIIRLRIDTSKNVEWKTRNHSKKKIIDNNEYIEAVMKLAELNKAHMNKIPGISIDGKYYKKANYKNEIKKIETVLPTLSPKIEKYVSEKSSYQVEKHTMKAFVQIGVDVLYQNGMSLWPSKTYDDEFIIEDLVISPDLESSIPSEKAGDPLALPSDYEFMKMAVDHIVDTKIVPDLTAEFNNYGMRFFNTANKLSPVDKQPVKTSEEFEAAIEDYYKFLVCYKDKGHEDNIPEKVIDYLDSFISDKWILGIKVD